MTKTGRGRQLPLPRQVLEAVRHYSKDGRPQNGPDDHVFLRHPRRYGYPLSRSALKAMVGQACRHCGFPPSWWGTHRLHHTCAMHLLQAGVAIEIIALWLGHEQLSTTHGYLEADLGMKEDTLAHLKAPKSSRRTPNKASSHVLAFLEAL